MLTSESKQDLIALFDKVIDAFVKAESDALLGSLDDEDDNIAIDEYKYGLSRINTVAEEWRKDLYGLLNGNTG